MNVAEYHKLFLIDKLKVLRAEYKDIYEEYLENEEVFKEIVDSYDDLNMGYSIQELTLMLNMVMNKSDELLEKIHAVQTLLNEAKSQLMN